VKLQIFHGLVSVILTFEEEAQLIYNTEATFVLPDLNSERERQIFEIDVVRQLINPTDIGYNVREVRDMSRLVKISLCYSENPKSGNPDADYEAAIDYLCRNNAKYYFQPNQRDEFENLLVSALNIAGNTADFT
jgi:hypothetical protein